MSDAAVAMGIAGFSVGAICGWVVAVFWIEILSPMRRWVKEKEE